MFDRTLENRRGNTCHNRLDVVPARLLVSRTKRYVGQMKGRVGKLALKLQCLKLSKIDGGRQFLVYLNINSETAEKCG